MTAADWKPTPKIVGGGAAGAVTTIVLWLLGDLAHLQLPAGVAAAISLLVTLGAAYWIPQAARVDEPPLTEDERLAVRHAFHQAAQNATVTLRVSGSQAAEQELADSLFDWFERRRDQAGG